MLPPLSQLRTFTLPPYLTDPELVQLAGLFPSWVTTKSGSKALEEGSSGGHGTVRIGKRPRDANFAGSMMERFLLWLKRLFLG